MPFYLVEQKGVPGARLVEADKPATAKNHVIADTFAVTRLEDRALLDAAKVYDVEVAGAPRQEVEPEPEPMMTNGGNPGDTPSGDGLDPDAATDDFGERD